MEEPENRAEHEQDRHGGDVEAPVAAPQRKSVGWRLTVDLKRRVAAEAKAQGEQIEVLVERWLDEKVGEAEDKRHQARHRRGVGT
jgi:hypothetical protein